MQVVYLCGSADNSQENRWHFADADMAFQYLGYAVLNPMMLPDGLGELKRTNICNQYLFVSDCVCMMPGWKQCESAKDEKRLAHKLKKKVLYYTRVDVARQDSPSIACIE